MKVIHIESGLGNQMLSYCEYLAIKQANPHDNCYIENIIFDIPECNEVIRQWNGYEVDRIFHLKTPNIKDLFSEEEWATIISEVKTTRFWEKNWNYPVYITQILQDHGIDLINTMGDFEAEGQPSRTCNPSWFTQNAIMSHLRYYRKKLLGEKRLLNFDHTDQLFIKTDDSIFAGQKLLFYYKNSGIDRIENDIRTIFKFGDIPPTDTPNIEALNMIKNCQSVSIHVRRGDAMYANYQYFARGYYKKAVKFIKKQVEKPVFFVFCDPDSVQWAKDNERQLGLDFKKDKIFFVDWNKGESSWYDMQLMSNCHHNIIGNSSFAWWGAWLNPHIDKITISPEVIVNTTHHF